MTQAAPARSGRTSDLPKVLVADDQHDVTRALQLLLRGEGFDVDCADSPEKVLAAVQDENYDVVLIDLNYTRDTTSGGEGLKLLDKLRELDQELRIVVMTAWSTVELAVSALQRGAADFVEKPWKNNRLLTILRSQAALGGALRDQRRIRAAGHRQIEDAAGGLIAEAPAMLQVLEIASRVAPSDANVLITGENGTGKSLIGKQIHLMSERAQGPFVVVNMGGLASGVFESEMFGHLKGAFTDAKEERIGRIEMAHGGTLFLDEIGNMPMDQQTKLLHVIETGRFEPVGASRSRISDVRLITATNAELKQAVADGTFRKDLYFRLNTVEIELPTLTERPEDIEPLARHFLARHKERYGRPDLDLSTDALDVLRAYPWPGNVRELDHIVERAVLLAGETTIEPADLRLEADGGALNTSLPLMTIDAAEGALIKTAMSRFDGNVVKAAEALGLSRSALYRRMEKHGLGK
jgi:DNA-binding NtrC family response regulator